MRWNILVALFAFVLSLLQLGINALTYFDPDRGTPGYSDMLFGATAAVALLLSYPLLRGHNWARIVLIFALGCCAIGVVLLVPYSFIANHWIFTRLVISFDGASTVFIIVLFIMLLLHSDVRHAFTKPSNKSLEPTADHCDIHL
jgi:hypothetical protein